MYDITPDYPGYAGPKITLDWGPGGWAIANADTPGCTPWVLVPMPDAKHTCESDDPCWCGRRSVAGPPPVWFDDPWWSGRATK